MRPGWRLVFETPAYTAYEAAPGVLVSQAVEGHDEILEDAQESLRCNAEYFRSVGLRGRVVVIADGMNSQSLAVRRYYAANVTPLHYERVALVGLSGFGRALVNMFLGLHRPTGVELKVFADVDQALVWVQEEG